MERQPADSEQQPIIGGRYGTPGDGERAEQAAAEMEERAGEAAREAREQARARAEQVREQAASGLEKAAEQMRSRAQGQAGAPGEVGTKLADQLDRSSQYLHEHDTSEMLHDVREYMRRHPVQAMAGAAATGFVIGRILR